MTKEPHKFELSWSCHPARERMGRTLFGVCVIAAMAVLSGLLMQHWIWTVGAAVLLLAVLNRFFLPTRYDIDSEGITARFPFRQQRLEWSSLRRSVMGPEVGYLSPAVRERAWRAQQGMPIFFGRCRAAVVDAIDEHLPAAVRRVEA